jgi:lipoprotein-releasing system ATP-binding protein
MSIIIADSIIKSYSMHSMHDTPVLKGLSLTIEQGEFIAFMGPSGAGKSTLLHILGLLDFPDSGSIQYTLSGNVFSQSSMKKGKSAELRNKHIGFIFQFHHLLPEFTALENIMMPALIGGMAMSKAKNKAMTLAEQVGMSHRIEHRPSELSGGEQQRIAIARSLMNDPEIIIADEPTGNLDEHTADIVLSEFMGLVREQGSAALVATHNERLAAKMDRIVRLHDGFLA